MVVDHGVGRLLGQVLLKQEQSLVLSRESLFFYKGVLPCFLHVALSLHAALLRLRLP